MLNINQFARNLKSLVVKFRKGLNATPSYRLITMVLGAGLMLIGLVIVSSPIAGVIATLDKMSPDTHVEPTVFAYICGLCGAYIFIYPDTKVAPLLLSPYIVIIGLTWDTVTSMAADNPSKAYVGITTMIILWIAAIIGFTKNRPQ